MIEIRINGHLIDLEIPSIMIEENASFFGEETQGDFSYPFTVPRTDTNSAVFGGLWAAGLIPPQTRYDCEIAISGNRWKRGTFVIDEVFRDTLSCHLLADTANIGRFQDRPIGDIATWSVQIPNAYTTHYAGLLPYLPMGSDLCFPTINKIGQHGYQDEYNIFDAGQYPAFLGTRSGRGNEKIIPFANLNFVFQKTLEAIGYAYEPLPEMENVYVGTGENMPMQKNAATQDLLFGTLTLGHIVGSITLGHLANCLKPVFGKILKMERARAYWVSAKNGRMIDGTGRVHDVSFLYQERKKAVLGFANSEKSPLADFEADSLADFPDPVANDGLTGLARAEFRYYTAEQGSWLVQGVYASARPTDAQEIGSCFHVMPMPETVVSQRTGNITDNGSGMARLTMRLPQTEVRITKSEAYITAAFVTGTPSGTNTLDLPLPYSIDDAVELDVRTPYTYRMYLPEAPDPAKLYIFHYNGVTDDQPWGHVSGYTPLKCPIVPTENFRYYGSLGIIERNLQQWLKLQGFKTDTIGMQTPNLYANRQAKMKMVLNMADEIQAGDILLIDQVSYLTTKIRKTISRSVVIAEIEAIQFG